MKVTRTSMLTGVQRTREIPMTKDQYIEWAERGGLIQEVFPELSPDDREFLMTGITPREWEEVFGDEDEDLEDDEPAF